MKKYKPKKWFIYTRIIAVFICIFFFSRTTNEVYKEITVNNDNDTKSLKKEVIISNKEEIYVAENPILNEYTSIPELGFNVTLGNKKYDLSLSDYDLLVAVVASESNVYKDDILAVMSVILNRADAKNISPIDVITAKGQFSGYLGGHYLKYMNSDGSLTSKTAHIQEVVSDALNGLRNNNYYSFRSNWVVDYSDNLIVPKGNRYR